MTMPVYHDLYCYRGQTFRQSLYFKENGSPIDLTGNTFKAEVRPMENSPILTAEMNVTLWAKDGTVVLMIPAEVTATFQKGFGYWDLKATDEHGDVQYWIKGKFIVNGRITQ